MATKNFMTRYARQKTIAAYISRKLDQKYTITCLPPEVLEIIFGKLFSIKDIVSCNKTCTKWKHVIQSMFKDKGAYFIHRD